MISTDEPIIVEVTFNTTVNRVWTAITRPDEMKQWYFRNIDSFKPEIGFTTQFEVQVEDRKFTHLWHVTEVVPDRRITYQWEYKEYPGDSFVTFELNEVNDQVKLRLVVQVVESFPGNIPEFSRDSCMNGWNYFIGKNLREYLETKAN